MREVKDWKITKSWFGRKIKFKCPVCKTGLAANLREAGSLDQCPDCATWFSVPGEAYKFTLNENKERKALEKKQAKERAAHEKAERKAHRIAEKTRREKEFDELCFSTTESSYENAIPIAETTENNTAAEDTDEVYARFNQGLASEASMLSFASWSSEANSQFNFAALPDHPELKTDRQFRRWERCKDKARTWLAKYSDGNLKIAAELADRKKLAFWLFEKNAPKNWLHCNLFQDDWETVSFTTRFVPRDFHYHFKNLMESDTNPANFFYSCYEKSWAPLGRVWWRRNTQYVDPVEGISTEFDKDIERLYELLEAAQFTTKEAHSVKLRADAHKQRLISNAKTFDWTSVRGKPPSEVKPRSEYLLKMEVSLNLDNCTITVDGKTIDLNTYIDSYAQYETWVSSDFKNIFRRAATKYHPDLAKNENERDKRKAIMAKLNTFYENGDELGLQQFLNELAID